MILTFLIPVGLFKKRCYDNEITDIKGKIPNITGLATTSALNPVNNEITNVSNLVKKAEYDEKISDIDKYQKYHIIIFLITIKLQMIYLMQR